MKNQESKKLVKELILKLKQIKDVEIKFTKNKIIKCHNIDEKYVTKRNYKELVALFALLKDDNDFDAKKYEKMIDQNAKKFPFLFKCYESIYDFVSELKFGGPIFIAKEMSRQGKEIDYIHGNVVISDSCIK